MNYREKIASAKKIRGSGIGLSLVKIIVELHNGEIAAISKGLNQGVIFEIKLPKC